MEEDFSLEVEGIEVSSTTLVFSSLLLAMLFKIESLMLSLEEDLEKIEQEETAKAARTLKQRKTFLFFISVTSRTYYIP